MNFIVVGCGRVGAELAYHLFASGHQVVVVDSRKEAFNRLHPDFRGRTLEGEGLAESVLERAGIREADGLAAVTNSDTLNAVVAHTAITFITCQMLLPVTMIRICGRSSKRLVCKQLVPHIGGRNVWKSC